MLEAAATHMRPVSAARSGKFLPLDDIEGGQGGGAGERIATKGAAVHALCNAPALDDTRRPDRSRPSEYRPPAIWPDRGYPVANRNAHRQKGDPSVQSRSAPRR